MNALLSVAQVAERLGMSEEWVRDRCADGTIPAFKLGRAWRIEPADLQAWIEDQRHRPARPVDTFEPEIARRPVTGGSLANYVRARDAA